MMTDPIADMPRVCATPDERCDQLVGRQSFEGSHSGHLKREGFITVTRSPPTASPVVMLSSATARR